MILGQQAGHSLEFPKIQSENCLHGRESPGSKELKRVNLNILPNSAFGCPTHDLHGFSLPNGKSLHSVQPLSSLLGLLLHCSTLWPLTAAKKLEQ
jgi:hypothetical protein